MVRYQLWIAATAGAIFFTNLGAAALFDMDEALYATCAREMRDRGNLIVPWFNGAMFPEKPPLMFWTMMGGYELFDVNELGARFFSAVFGVGTALVAFHLGRILFSPRVGLWAGLITASTIVFTISARAATVDSALTFFTALAFLMFAMGWRKSAAGSGQSAVGSGQWAVDGGQSAVDHAEIGDGAVSNPQSPIPNPSFSQFPLPYAIAAYVCIGVTVLGKGPVGMLLPLAAMGLFLLATNGEKKVSGTICAKHRAPTEGWSGRFGKLYLSPFSANGWRSLFRSAWWMRPFTMILVIAVVAVPWYVAVGYETHWEWPRQFIRDFCLRPFQQPIQGHGDATTAIVSILYYFYQIPAVLIGFFPWSVFLGPTLVDAFRRLREGKKGKGEGKKCSTVGKPLAASQSLTTGNDSRNDEPTSQAARWHPGVVLALCWFGTWFLFWSICKTKLLHYLLPAYPALALLTACFIDRWLSAEAEKGSELLSGGQSASKPRWPGKTVLTPFSPWALRNAWISMIAVGVGIVIAVPFIAAKFLPGEGRLGLLGLLLVLGGGWCWWKTSRGLYSDAAITFVITSAAFLIAVFGFAVLRVDRFQNATPMMAAICTDEEKADEEKGSGVFSPHPRSPVATYCFFRESTVFYGGKPVTKCDDDEASGRSARQALAQFLAKPGRSYVITTDEYEPELMKAFSNRLQVIHREPRFLADGKMVIFRHGD
jgi:4-amino-4-deoxy-L-arabinose transferase-like glycosyltransferase